MTGWRLGAWLAALAVLFVLDGMLGYRVWLLLTA